MRQVAIGRVVTLPVAATVENRGKVCNIPDHAVDLTSLQNWDCEFEAGLRIFPTMRRGCERDGRAQVYVCEEPSCFEEILLSGSGRMLGGDIGFYVQHRECQDQRF
jgi:hypothetical protein